MVLCRMAGPSPLRIWGALLIVYVVWGSTYLAIRIAVETVPPMFAAGIRFTIAGVTLFGWSQVAGARVPSSRGPLPPSATGPARWARCTS